MFNEMNYGSQLTQDGHEFLDNTPISVGVPFRRPTPLHLRIRQQILQMMQETSEEDETFADADDFVCDDDPVPYSPYEFEDDFDHINDSTFINAGAGVADPSNGTTAKQESMTDNSQSSVDNGTTES